MLGQVKAIVLSRDGGAGEGTISREGAVGLHNKRSRAWIITGQIHQVRRRFLGLFWHRVPLMIVTDERLGVVALPWERATAANELDSKQRDTIQRQNRLTRRGASKTNKSTAQALMIQSAMVIGMVVISVILLLLIFGPLAYERIRGFAGGIGV